MATRKLTGMGESIWREPGERDVKGWGKDSVLDSPVDVFLRHIAPQYPDWVALDPYRQQTEGLTGNQT